MRLIVNVYVHTCVIEIKLEGKRINARCERNSRFRRTNRDGGRGGRVSGEGDVLSRTSISRSPLEISHRVLSDYPGSRCASRKWGIAELENTRTAKFERWCTFKVQICHGAGRTKNNRGRMKGGMAEEEGWVLRLHRGRETRERKGDLERRVANRNEGLMPVVEEQSRTGAINEKLQCKKRGKIECRQRWGKEENGREQDLLSCHSRISIR